MSIKEQLKFWESVLEERSEQDEICPKCATKVYRRELRLRGRNWHRECFQCVTCAKLLNLATFKEINNEIFCSDCYAECFSRRWRCSELIDEKMLSKQLASVVMEGHRYRWLPRTPFANDSDSLRSENTASFYSAASDACELPSGPPCRRENSTRSGSRENESPCDPSESDCDPRTLPHDAAEQRTAPLSSRFGMLRTPNSNCTPRQILRGRFTASEGLPGSHFDSSKLVFGDAERALDLAHLRNASVGDREENAVQIEDASCQTESEHSFANIPSIPETSEDSGASEATDSEESRVGSSASEEQACSPPKPLRRRTTGVNEEHVRDQSVAKPHKNPKRLSAFSLSRHGNGHIVRQTRFPSDHIADVSIPSRE